MRTSTQIRGTAMTTAITYRAFLLRVWTPANGSQVKSSVTDVTTGEVRVFPDLGHLCDWLGATAAGATRDDADVSTRSPRGRVGR